VAFDREITHPLAKRTKKLFQPTSKDNRGWLVPTELKTPHLRVSADALPRALRILDALFVAIEEDGHPLSWPTDPKATLKILVDGEEIELILEEIFTQKPHALTPEESAQKKRYLYDYSPKWDYVPSGVLHLAIENLPYELSRLRKSWRDGKTRRIEDCLSDFVAILPHVAKLEKIVKENREREEMKRREEQKQAEDLTRKREEYARKEKVADRFLDLWRKSKAFTDLADSINKALETSTATEEQETEIRKISDWIAKHALNLDPLTDFDWMIRQFKDPYSHYD